MEVKENNILTFYRGQEDIVVNEKANYAESLFKDYIFRSIPVQFPMANSVAE